MAGRFDRADRMLGRLVFRATGTLCALVASACAYFAYRHATDWHSGSYVPAILFGLVAIAAGCAVPYCYSAKRTLSEALDAMEGGAGDLPRRRDR